MTPATDANDATEAVAPDTLDGRRFPVLRRPGAAALLQAVRDADIVVHNQISLRLAWPLVLLKRPWFVVHHTWIDQHGAPRLAVGAKRLALHAARNLAVSEALAHSLAVSCTTVPNPYDDTVFRRIDGVRRDGDFVFVGRLVSDKGAALLVRALARLAQRGLHAKSTIVGTGPEEGRLRDLVRQAGLDGDVHFAGRQQGEQLARTLNAHRHVVVPSMWDEPFGLVALEALACGCRALVADCGGLREAAGPNAIAFAKGDAAELALRLEGCIDHGAGTAARCADAEASMLRHLERHRPAAVAERYLEIFARVLEQRRAWT